MGQNIIGSRGVYLCKAAAGLGHWSSHTAHHFERPRAGCAHHLRNAGSGPLGGEKSDAEECEEFVLHEVNKTRDVPSENEQPLVHLTTHSSTRAHAK